ncbi:hypothetical protein [Lysobacter sp. yr284]|uniref:hypothetical protein n=1 Tax=Lysobacter sp. yr284 TaxID=1761791 RepID=UPI001113471E|nr:hypothetical protein [Lysobacter sp. yr284]
MTIFIRLSPADPRRAGVAIAAQDNAPARRDLARRAVAPPVGRRSHRLRGVRRRMATAHESCREWPLGRLAARASAVM